MSRKMYSGRGVSGLKMATPNINKLRLFCPKYLIYVYFLLFFGWNSPSCPKIFSGILLSEIVGLCNLHVFMQSTEFTVADLLLLFGHADIDEAFSELDRDNDGEVSTLLP